MSPLINSGIFSIRVVAGKSAIWYVVIVVERRFLPIGKNAMLYMSWYIRVTSSSYVGTDIVSTVSRSGYVST